MIIDERIMLVLGFKEISWQDAKARGFHASIDGDNVWYKEIGENAPDIWVQGYPSGPILFNMIFNAGRIVGDKLRRDAIKESLGL